MFMANVEELKKRRKKLGYSCAQLALKADLPTNAISRIEGRSSRGTHPIRAKAIAKALGCEVEDIFTPIRKGA